MFGSSGLGLVLNECDLSQIYFAPMNETISRTNDLFRLCNELNRESRNKNEGLVACLLEECRIDFDDFESNPNVLSQHFSDDEIQQLTRLFKWYVLLARGQLLDCSLEDIKSLLGVQSLRGLLDPIQQSKSELSVDDLSLIIIVENRSTETPFERVLNKFAVFVRKVSEADSLIQLISYCFEFSKDVDLSQFEPSFQKMDQCQRLYWLFFIAVGSKWPSEILYNSRPYSLELSNQLRKLLCGIHLAMNLKVKKDNSFPPRIDPPPIERLPGMPNWMPNGGGSCYVSSVLWSLFLLADEEIRKEIFPDKNQVKKSKVDEEVDRAKQLFSSLYDKLSSSEDLEITKKEINDFIRQLKRVFPNRFHHPDSVTAHEDAGDFLMCIIDDLLGLKSFSGEGSEFSLRNSFERIDDAPLVDKDRYDYESAMEPSFRPEHPSVISIQLSEKADSDTLSYLNNLVETERVVGDMDKEVLPLDENTNLSKRYIKVVHKEQLSLNSRESAPKFFIGRLDRFFCDYRTGVREKRFVKVVPVSTLRIKTRDGESVKYNLVSVVVHDGSDIDGGHYYTFCVKKIEGLVRPILLDDMDRKFYEVREEDARIKRHVTQNGYLYFYQKDPDA